MFLVFIDDFEVKTSFNPWLHIVLTFNLRKGLDEHDCVMFELWFLYD